MWARAEGPFRFCSTGSQLDASWQGATNQIKNEVKATLYKIKVDIFSSLQKNASGKYEQRRLISAAQVRTGVGIYV